MKKNAMKLVILSFFAFCLTLNLSAQEVQRPGKSGKTDEQKMEKKMNRLNKMADKLEMTTDQRKQFIDAQLSFNERAKAIKKSVTDKEARKAQLETLAADHKNNLATFLSAEQMTKVEKRFAKRKGKRKGKKGKKKGKKMRASDTE